MDVINKNIHYINALEQSIHKLRVNLIAYTTDTPLLKVMSTQDKIDDLKVGWREVAVCNAAVIHNYVPITMEAFHAKYATTKLAINRIKEIKKQNNIFLSNDAGISNVVNSIENLAIEAEKDANDILSVLPDVSDKYKKCLSEVDKCKEQLKAACAILLIKPKSAKSDALSSVDNVVAAKFLAPNPQAPATPTLQSNIDHDSPKNSSGSNSSNGSQPAFNANRPNRSAFHQPVIARPEQGYNQEPAPVKSCCTIM